AEAALRVRRRLLVQHGPAHLVAALTATLDALGRTGSRPFGAGKGGAVARLLGRDRAERLVLAYYRQFDRSAYRALQDNFW
ncbi:hypothetical protein NL358_28150, partial [Klebsiella pneumoniae]|nr:hypothetical protein [Klebsiella pneumoniae]